MVRALPIERLRKQRDSSLALLISEWWLFRSKLHTAYLLPFDSLRSLPSTSSGSMTWPSAAYCLLFLYIDSIHPRSVRTPNPVPPFPTYDAIGFSA